MIRRILIGLLLLLLCLGALAFALPIFMSSQIVREEVARQISELTGRNVTLRGDQALQMFPNPSVELSDVVIEGDVPGAENALVITETLRGAVRALPLLFGRVELYTFELTRPTIQLIRDADGQANWTMDGSDLMSSLDGEGAVDPVTALGRFRLTDGTLRYVDAVRGIDETLSAADLSLSWPSSSTRAALSGSAIWRGEAVEISASLAQPSTLTQAGATSGVVLSVAAAPLRLQFDGTMTPGAIDNGRPWQASGTVAVSTPSMRRAANWLGTQVGAGSTFGAFRLDAAMNLVGLTVDLTDAQVSLDGNEGEGVLTVDLDGYQNGGEATGRPSLQGTLDFNRLDLSAYLDGLRPTTTVEAPGDWRFSPMPDLLHGGFDADIRFATRQVLASQFTLGETAGSLLIAENQVSLGIAEAIAYGGSIRGSLTLDHGEQSEGEAGPRVATTLDLSMDSVELGPMLAALQDEPRLVGAFTARALLSGAGSTLGGLLEALEGDATVDVMDGAITGIDLDAIAESFVDGSFDLTALTPGGETEINRLSGTLLANGGFVQVQQLDLETDRLSLTMNGGSNVAGQTLALNGATAITDGNDTVVVPFDVRGTWSEPLLIPDLRALEER